MTGSRARVGWLVFTGALVFGACSSSAATTVPAGASSAPGGASAAPSTAVASPAAATATCSEAAPAGAVYSLATCALNSPSLAGNLLGDAPVVSTFILTPSDYATSGRRYPVVYMLGGWTDPATGDAYALASAPTPADPKAVMPILAVVSGVNAFGGGMYVNSSVSGNWEDAIVKDLVGYVDANYRTIARRESRGIAGASMGGFGAVNIAMRHADVFGALYAMSPGLFDATGAEARLNIPGVSEQVLAIEAAVAGKTPTEAALQLETDVTVSVDVQFEWAYGTAFAPDPTSPSLMQFPFKSENGKTVRDDALWAKWEAGFGDLSAKVTRYKSALSSLAGIVVDYGTADEYVWIPKGSHYFVGLLQGAGIGVVESTFDGGHTDQLGDRLVNHMLPFMIEKLAAS